MMRQISSVVLLVSMVAVPALAAAEAPERHSKHGAKPSWRRRAPKQPEQAVQVAPAATTTDAKPATAASDPIPPGHCRCAIPGAFRHGGFYQRIALGAGYASAWGDGPSGDASISGLASSLAVYTGGTPWAGLVLGGMLGVSSASGWFHGAASEGDGSFALLSLALFADWYPDPRGAWHLGGAFGLGGYAATDIAEASYTGGPFAGSIFGGYDLWIGPQHSYGLMLSGSLTPPSSARDDGQRTGHRLMAASGILSVTLVYH